MAHTNGASTTINRLVKLASSFSDACGERLNGPLRQNLKDFAPAQGYSFQQDNVGNIYITRPGLDKEHSAIALAFDLDSFQPASTLLLLGALKTFLNLENSKTACDIILLGWSSPGGQPLGRKAWDGVLSTSEAHALEPELKTFAGLPDPEKIVLSAIVQVVEDENETLVAQGSPLLTEKVRVAASGGVKIEKGGVSTASVPGVYIRGKDATGVGKETIEMYSRYVAGLFENFD